MSRYSGYEDPAITYWASKITTNLYLGSKNAAEDKDRLLYSGITHIVVAGSDLQCLYPLNFVYLQLPIEDEEGFPIDKYFDTFNQFVKHALSNSENKVLVHCYAGASRSVTLITQYLVNVKNISPKKALNYVKKVHPPANPNLYFLELINSTLSK